MRIKEWPTVIVYRVANNELYILNYDLFLNGWALFSYIYNAIGQVMCH